MDALERIRSTSSSTSENPYVALWPAISRWQLRKVIHLSHLFRSLLSGPHWPPTMERKEQVFSIILQRDFGVFVMFLLILFY